MDRAVSLGMSALGIPIALALMGLGCEGRPQARVTDSKELPAKATERATAQEPYRAEAEVSSKPPGHPAPSKKVPLGKDVWFETDGHHRRVLVAAAVCLREGGLECLLCRSRTKEHESILATDADAQVIHAGLLAAGAKPGSPVQYVEKKGEVVIVPPTGSRIKISIRYEDKGKPISRPAQQWIVDAKTKKNLEDDWVFAGSRLLPNPDEKNKKPIYAAAGDGSYICIYNMPYAMLDLPVDNPNKDPEIRELQPQTERIPPLETRVTLILEPQPDNQKQEQ